MWYVIGTVIVFGSILAVFSRSDSDNTWGDIGRVLFKIVMFVPMVILGIILHIAGDFKNHRLGYIVVFLVVALIAFGMYMGIKSGPSIPVSPFD